MASPFDGKRTHHAMIIHRVGETVSIKRDDGSATENQYGKVPDKDRVFSVVAEESAHRIYEGSNDESSQQLIQGGRVDNDQPMVLFKYDTEAQEGDHVEFPDGSEYELERVQTKQTYKAFRAALLQS